VRIVSPWSGRTLHIHSFLHACFVWFGLSRFWEQAVADASLAQGEVDALRDQARLGFGRPALAEALDAASPYLSAEGEAVLRPLIDVAARELV
jgi:hypothetical protein